MKTTHPSVPAGNTQAGRILAVLESTAAWVGMPSLSRVSGSLNVHSRITNLREAGYKIDQQQHREGHAIHSEYRLRKAAR